MPNFDRLAHGRVGVCSLLGDDVDGVLKDVALSACHDLRRCALGMTGSKKEDPRASPCSTRGQ